MRFKLSEEFKQEIILGKNPIPNWYSSQAPPKYYDGVLEKAKVLVYGYAKFKAKEQIKKNELEQRKAPKFEIDWSYVIPSTYTVTLPAGTITTAGSNYTSPNTSITYTGSSVPVSLTSSGSSSDIKVHATNNSIIGPAVFNISDVSNRISAKVKEIMINEVIKNG